jgi:CHAD domain-containing protein
MKLNYVKMNEIKPALSGYISEAGSILKAADFPNENSVHDIRVLMKKARATLNIISPQLNAEFAAREYQSLREVGRIMRTWRETSVLRKSLKELKKKYPDVFLKLESNEKLMLILKKPELNIELAELEKNNVVQIEQILYKSGYRIRFEPMNTIDPMLLIKELESTYNRVARNYLVCRNNPKPDRVHELRKSSKDFLYQLWIFRPINPKVIKLLEKKLDSMAMNLGKYNDLTQLIRDIGYKYEYMANPPELDELMIIVREKQDKYLEKVWPLAHELFCPGRNFINVLGFKLLLI